MPNPTQQSVPAQTTYKFKNWSILARLAKLDDFSELNL